jgi:Metallo-peptidase family M12
MSFLALLVTAPLLALGGRDLPPSVPEVVRGRVAPLPVGEFDDEIVRLELFPGVDIEAVRDAVVPFGPESFAWVGHAKGDDASSIVLSVTRGVLSASLRVGSRQFRVRPAGAALYRIEELQSSSESEPPDRQPLPTSPGRAGREAAGSADDGTSLDLLVVYTRSARMAAGGSDAIESLVHLGVAETNVALERSGVPTRLRLVELREVAYREAGRVESDLEILQRDSDDALDEVHRLRDASGADFVQLVVEERDGCGISYSIGDDDPGFADWAFSVVERGCIDSSYAMAHELGHNFGCDHAPEDPTTRAAFGFSRGYKDLAAGFRTIMAYGPGVRVALFSSPRASFRGLAAGTDRQDNARSIGLVRTKLARFRNSIPPPRLSRAREVGVDRTSFRIAPEDRGILEWRLVLGTRAGAADLFDSGSRTPLETATAVGLDVGRPVFARLWYRRGNVWLHDDLEL